MKPNVNMTENRSHINELVKAFVSGTATQEELAALNAFVRESDENREYVQWQQELLFTQSVMDDTTPYDAEAAIARFHAHLATQEKELSRGTFWLRPSSPTLWWRVAVAVLLVVLPLSTYVWVNKQVEGRFADISMTVPEGSQLDLTLPDGTKVRLNSGSVLSYSQGFGITDRKVKLTGEGWFEVKHDEALPFSVVTDEMEVNDLGTVFSFSNYANEQTAEVNLYEGKVSVVNLIPAVHATTHLNPGDRLVLDKVTGTVTKSSTSGDARSARAMTELNFLDMSVDEVAKVLSRTYNIKIDVADTVRNRRFYGFFNRKEHSVDDILQAMSATGGVHFKHNKQHYIIY